MLLQTDKKSDLILYCVAVERWNGKHWITEDPPNDFQYFHASDAANARYQYWVSHPDPTRRPAVIGPALGFFEQEKKVIR